MRNALVISLGLAATLILSGCPTAKNNKVMLDAGPGPATAPAPMGMSSVPELPPPPPTSPMPTYTPAPPPQPMQPAVAPAPAPAPTGQRIHVVKSGESLWKISAAEYGKASQAGVNKILRANPTVTDPSKIKAGQKLVIPD